jgi:hypothetical protein
MLYGEHLTLRPIRETDVDAVYAAHIDIRFNNGRNQDLLIYSLVRSDPRPWRAD